MTTPSLLLPNDRTEAQVRAMRQLSMIEVIREGAVIHHPTRDMPQCQWQGVHRYDFDSRTEDGKIIERCMDCKTKTRVVSA